jgi:hypothetical protein
MLTKALPGILITYARINARKKRKITESPGVRLRKTRLLRRQEPIKPQTSAKCFQLSPPIYGRVRYASPMQHQEQIQSHQLVFSPLLFYAMMQLHRLVFLLLLFYASHTNSNLLRNA